MHFPVKKALISLAVATALTVIALVSANVINKPNPVETTTTQTIPTTGSNIETIIAETPTTSVTEDKAVLQLGLTSLKYQKGNTSWETGIGKGMLIKGAFIDEKERYVVGWGRQPKDEFYTKISFIDLKTGFENSEYVLELTRVNKILALYDVPTSNGLTDYLVLLGETIKGDIVTVARVATKQVGINVPVMEILRLNTQGSERFKSDVIIVPDYGTVPGGSAVRNKGGDYTVTLDLETRSDPKGIKYSVNTNDFPNLKNGTPIFELR